MGPLHSICGYYGEEMCSMNSSESGGLSDLTSRQDNAVTVTEAQILKQKSFTTKDRDTGVCVGLNLPFSLICLSLEGAFRKEKGNTGLDRKS